MDEKKRKKQSEIESQKEIKNQKEMENQKIIEDFDYLGNAASSGDCTGLIPEGEGKEEDLKNYQDVYRFGSPLQKNK